MFKQHKEIEEWESLKTNNKLADLIANILFILSVNGLNISVKWQRLTEQIKKTWPNYILFTENVLQIWYKQVASKRIEKIYYVSINQRKAAVATLISEQRKLLNTERDIIG